VVLVLSDEPDHRLAGRSSSAAKKVEAAFKTALARRSSAFSRFNRLNSAESSDVVLHPHRTLLQLRRVPPWVFPDMTPTFLSSGSPDSQGRLIPHLREGMALPQARRSPTTAAYASHLNKHFHPFFEARQLNRI